MTHFVLSERADEKGTRSVGEDIRNAEKKIIYSRLSPVEESRLLVMNKIDAQRESSRAVEVVQQAVTIELNSIPVQAFRKRI
ncbi:hypothetical protein TNCV_3062171 [Trichonephila clavipes]|nr:hypothetical protein TNCV_3062171 [Trichonephila clavipes]